MRPGDNLNVRIEPTRLLDDLARLEGLGNGHHQHSRLCDRCLCQDLRRGGVANNQIKPVAFMGKRYVVVRFDERDALTGYKKLSRNSAPDATMTNQNDRSFP